MSQIDDDFEVFLRTAMNAHTERLAVPHGLARRALHRVRRVQRAQRAVTATAAAATLGAAGVVGLTAHRDTSGGTAHTGVPLTAPSPNQLHIDEPQTPDSPKAQALASQAQALAAQAQAVATGMQRLRAYLDTWIRDGAIAAGRFRVPDQQTSVDQPDLLAATVTGQQVTRWVSSDQFTVMVTMQMHFAGDGITFGEGVNTRFVTFTRSGPDQPYLLSFATSP